MSDMNLSACVTLRLVSSPLLCLGDLNGKRSPNVNLAFTLHLDTILSHVKK